MSMPRNLYPDTTLYLSVRAAHRSYWLVPKKKRVSEAVRFAFAVVSSRYREKWGVYEFEFFPTHYHLAIFEPA